jgi:hypothetical protein
MSSSEPCPRPGAKDTSCTLRPCCALARAEPPQLRSSSGSKRYILNALLMLRTFECKRYTLKDTCRLNVRAHSSSSLPLQSAAYASASTRSLCAPQRAHRRRLLLSSVLSFWAKTDFTGTCCSKSPVHRLVWRVGGRAPPQLQRVLALSPPRVGRFPCAQLRTTRDAAPSPARRARSMHAAVAVEVFHLPPSAPCGEPDEGALRPTPLPADSCRTAGIEEMGLHRIRQSVGATNKRPCFKTAASFDCGLSRHRDSRFFRAPGPPGDQTDDRLEEACGCRPHSARQRRAPCTASLATCYETPDVTWIETHDAARARGGLRSSHDGQPTALYCVPTNPGPRSFCARPVRWCR